MQAIENLNWKLNQAFVGDTNPEKVKEEDKISTLAYDQKGDYIAIGDNAGRLIIFESTSNFNTSMGTNYQYSNEFQSHIKESDSLILK